MYDAVMIISMSFVAVVAVTLFLLLVLDALKRITAPRSKPSFYTKPIAKRIDNMQKQEVLPLKDGVSEETVAVITAAMASNINTGHT